MGTTKSYNPGVQMSNGRVFTADIERHLFAVGIEDRDI